MVSSEGSPNGDSLTSPAGPPEDAAVGDPSPRPLAFYLPQFHPIPENNVSWGEGFTEWATVARATPRFPGHYQPRLPADLGFYDLRLPETRQAQADLAREHGIGGFVYYHYWFEGRELLERPFEEVLKTGEPDFPFCICWANHTWTWKRDSSERGRIVPQDYSEEDDREHIRHLLEAFQDERYIKVNGRPLFLIYLVHGLPDPKRTLDLWREEASKAGVAEPYICKVESFSNFTDPAEFGCDASVEFWPHGLEAIGVEPVEGRAERFQDNRIYNYEELIEKHLARPAPPFKRYPCVVPQWDNTARFKSTGARIIHDSTPELYGRWLRAVVEKNAASPPDEQLVFVNAWNEWAEGAYLEPDFRHGRAYLEANRQALRAAGATVPIPGTGQRGESPPPTSAEGRYKVLLDKYTLLQRRYTERLRQEEYSPLLQKTEDQVSELREENLKLRRRNRSATRKGDALARWSRQMDEGVKTLLNSRRWRLGSLVFEAPQRLLGRSRGPGVEDHLVEVGGKLREQLDAPEETRDPEGPDTPKQ